MIFLALLSFGWMPSYADSGHPTPVMPKEFEFMKHLQGTWEGTAQMEGKEEKTKVIYEVTSGGTAVAEKLAPDTKHEMITMYYKDGKNLGATHFCAVGNQPHMQLKKATSDSLEFRANEKNPIGYSKDEMHMGGIKLTLQTKDGTEWLRQEWTSFEKSKKPQVSILEFKRTK